MPAPRPAPEELTAGEKAAALALLAAFDRVALDLQRAALATAAGDPVAVAATLDLAGIGVVIEDRLLPVLVDEYATVVLDESRRYALGAFDPTVAARAWATDHAGRLIVEVTDATRTAVADVVADGLGRGASIDDVAGSIRRTVGLHSRYARAVDRRYLNMVSSGMREERAATLARSYAGKLRRVRAETIARWEVQSGRNTARLNTWREAYRAGGIQPGARKRWVVARPCDDCAALAADEPVPWDQPFANGRLMPPEHPNCKCTAVIVPLA